MVTLSKTAISILKGNGPLRDQVCRTLGVSMRQYYNYLKAGNPVLTAAAVIDLLQYETGLDRSQLLSHEKREILK